VLDNAPLESRADVLTYTSEPLPHPVEAIGPVEADIRIRSSLDHFDVFVRVCDVDKAGTSRNVCDALERVEPRLAEVDEDGVSRVSVRLWPTAHRFDASHRIRVQVSSGAHPRYARNLGTGEPLLQATRMVSADQAVFHDGERPSAVTLSVVGPAP
jgi:putative CocE/NonD family hydrolase